MNFPLYRPWEAGTRRRKQTRPYMQNNQYFFFLDLLQSNCTKEKGVRYTWKFYFAPKIIALHNDTTTQRPLHKNSIPLHSRSTRSSSQAPSLFRVNSFALIYGIFNMADVEMKEEKHTVPKTPLEEANTISKDKEPQKMFSLKKWNAIAMWSWDVECDTCAICRVQVMGNYLFAYV